MIFTEKEKQRIVNICGFGYLNYWLSMYVYSFEKLEVWIESKDFTKSIYLITSKFPDSEKFGLISQLRRASISICSNIAEGSVRKVLKTKHIFQQCLLVLLLKF